MFSQYASRILSGPPDSDEAPLFYNESDQRSGSIYQRDVRSPHIHISHSPVNQFSTTGAGSTVGASSGGGGTAAGGIGASVYGSRRFWTSSFGPKYIQSRILETSEDEDDEDDEEMNNILQRHVTADSMSSSNNTMNNSLNRHAMQTIRLDADDGPPEDIAIERQNKNTMDDNDDAGDHSFAPATSIRATTMPISESKMSEIGGKSSLYTEAPTYPVPHGHSPTYAQAYIPPTPAQPDTYVPPLYAMLPAHHMSWAYAFSGCVSTAIATSFVVWLTTEQPPTSTLPDTVYGLLRGSSRLLIIDTFLSMVVSAVWLVCMRRFVHLSVYALIAGVPLGLWITGIYTMIMSYRSLDGGYTGADKLLRLCAWLLLIGGGLWTYVMYHSRTQLDRALAVVRQASAVVNDNKLVIAVSAATVGALAIVTIAWTKMFQQLFLEGRLIKGRWILDGRVWLLALLYALLFLWACGVVSGMQRVVLAGVAAHWFFFGEHASAVADRDSADTHNPYRHISGPLLIQTHVQRLSPLFGTICLSSFVTIVTRIPIVIAPKRIGVLIERTLRMSNTLTLVSSPLTLTTAAITQQRLQDACERVPVVSEGTSYYFAKILLTTSRGLMAIILGAGAWVHGSLYYSHGYIVGILAGVIGWVVLGATEATLGATVDALYVCDKWPTGF